MCSTSFFSFVLIDLLTEGHYKFKFDNDEELHQFYVRQERSLDKHSMDEIIRRSWEEGNNVLKRKVVRQESSDGPNHTSVSETLTQDTYSVELSIEVNEMTQDFRDCFNFKEMFHTHYENVTITLGCKLPNTLKCELNTTSDMMNVTIGNFESNNELTRWKNGVRMDLTCMVNDVIGERRFGYNQPILLQYEKSEVAVGIPVIAGMVVVIFMALGLTVALVCHYKRNTRKKEMKWVDNPNYSRSVSLVSTDDDPFLPNWLKQKNEMIYDTSCIERGRRLGQGNFGTVFEGKIRLGTAM